MNNNIVNVIGTIVGEFAFDHSTKNEDFYLAYIASVRTSGVADTIPVMISEKVLTKMKASDGMRVEVEGSFRSCSYPKSTGGYGVKLYIFAELFKLTEKDDNNRIILTGYICKPPLYRETPHGRKITDVCLAVNRRTIKTDYLPILAWSREAAYLSAFVVGDKLSVIGRIQSREYQKNIGETYETRIAYEVSASWVGISKEENIELERQEMLV